MWTASGACAIFGIGVGVSEGIRESYYASVTAVAVLLLASGMFGLLVAAGSYLRLSRVGEAGIRSRSRAGR